jgi:hypothetical protein
MQSGPTVGWNGTDQVVVTVDSRSGVMTPYAWRITPSGQLRDPQGIPLSSAGAYAPGIACDTAGLCLIGSSSGGTVSGTRFFADGGFATTLVANSSAQTSVAVAKGNTGSFAVVWDPLSSDGGYEMRGARVATDGTLLDAVPVSLGEKSAFTLALTFDGTNYLLAFLYRNEIAVERLDTSLHVLDNPPLLLTDAGPRDVRIGGAASMPGLSLIGFEDSRNVQAGTWESFVARVTSSGVVLDPGGIRVCSSSFTCQWSQPTVVGGTFIVAWQDLGSLSVGAARVLPDGGNLDPSGIALPGFNLNFVRITSDGARAFVVSREDTAMGLVYGTHVFLDGGVDGLLAIPPTPMRGVDQQASSVACSGDTCLVAWAEVSTMFEIGPELAVRVTPKGALLDATAIPLLDGGNTPTVVAGPGQFLFYDHRYSGATYGLGAARVGLDGTVLDSMPLFFPGTTGAIVFEGAAYRVTYGTPYGDAGIYTAFIDPDGGELLAPGPQLACAGCTFAPDSFATATTPSTTLLATAVGFSPPTELLFSPGGPARSPAPTSLNGDMPDFLAGLVSPEGFLGGRVAYVGQTQQLTVQRLDVSGAVLDAAPIVLGQANGAALAAGDGGYVVLMSQAGSSVDVRGQLLTAQAALAGGAFDVAATPEPEQHPSVAVSPVGYLVAYEVYDPTVGIEAVRIAVRAIGLLPANAGCLQGFECASGVCSGGVCLEPPDAGQDAGSPDAGPPDAGPPDGGAPDAGPASPGVYRAACGCGSGPVLPLLAFAALPLRKWRRKVFRAGCTHAPEC